MLIAPATRKVIGFFVKAYPLRSFSVLIAFLCAGVAETLGIGALLPLLSIVAGQGGAAGQPGILQSGVEGFFKALGLPLSFEILLIAIVIAILVKAVIIFMAMRLVGYASANVSYDLRHRLISSLMKARWPYYTSLSSGHMANAAGSEALRAGQCYMLAGKTLSSSVQMLVYFSIALTVSWKISVAAVAAGALLFLAMRQLVRMTREAGIWVTDSLNSFLSRLNEALGSAKALKAMGQEERFIGFLRDDADSALKAQKKQILVGQIFMQSQEPMMVVLVAIGLFGIYKYTTTPLPELLIMAFLFSRLILHTHMVQNYYQNMVGNENAVLFMLKSIEAAEKEVERDSGTETPSLTREIAFDDVTIDYGHGPVIANSFIKIPARKVSVIFGPSGAGKTTLVDSILGLVQPASGRILVDDMPLSSLSVKSWRALVGYVPQDTYLFHDTIRANVTLGDQSIGDEEVIASLKEAAIWDFVESRPDGLDAIVGERGSALSGGQRQRIALARALVRKPTLLILDEATSGLDRESEELVYNSIRSLAGKVTVIIISHNPNSLNLADNVIDLQRTGQSHADRAPTAKSV